jgi:hypothetical protein
MRLGMFMGILTVDDLPDTVQMECVRQMYLTDWNG